MPIKGSLILPLVCRPFISFIAVRDVKRPQQICPEKCQISTFACHVTMVSISVILYARMVCVSRQTHKLKCALYWLMVAYVFARRR